MTPDVRIILPKKGRLKDALKEKFEAAAIAIEKPNERSDFGYIQSDELGGAEVLLQKDIDALENLTLGLADMAVVGKDKFIEYKSRIIADDGRCGISLCGEFNRIAPCRLQIAAAREISVPQELSGLRLVTSYPKTLKMWLRAQDVKNVNIIARDGGVEDYVRLGLADAICDVVQTGESLRANGLVPSMTIVQSSAVLVKRDNSDDSAALWAKWLTDKIEGASTAPKQTTILAVA